MTFSRLAAGSDLSSVLALQLGESFMVHCCLHLKPNFLFPIRVSHLSPTSVVQSSILRPCSRLPSLVNELQQPLQTCFHCPQFSSSCSILYVLYNRLSHFLLKISCGLPHYRNECSPCPARSDSRSLRFRPYGSSQPLVSHGNNPTLSPSSLTGALHFAVYLSLQ